MIKIDNLSAATFRHQKYFYATMIAISHKRNKWAYESLWPPRLKIFVASKSEFRKVFQGRQFFSSVERTKKNLKINFYFPSQFTSIIKKYNIHQRMHFSFSHWQDTVCLAKCICYYLREIINHQRLWPKEIYR